MSAIFEPVLTTSLTCPQCGGVTACVMLTDACQWFFECPACAAQLTPLPGDCCVYCSYADVPCPPVQSARQAQRKACCA